MIVKFRKHKKIGYEKTLGTTNTAFVSHPVYTRYKFWIKPSWIQTCYYTLLYKSLKFEIFSSVCLDRVNFSKTLFICTNKKFMIMAKLWGVIHSLSFVNHMKYFVIWNFLIFQISVFEISCIWQDIHINDQMITSN